MYGGIVGVAQIGDGGGGGYSNGGQRCENVTRIAGTEQENVQLVGRLEIAVFCLFIADVLFVFCQQIDGLTDAPEHDDDGGVK